jgi:hypothetical protein
VFARFHRSRVYPESVHHNAPKSAKAGIVAATKNNGQGLRFLRKPDGEVKACCTAEAFTAHPAGMS